MKKITMLMGSILLGGLIYGQQNPTGTPPANANNVNLTSRSAWYRGGNQPVGPAGTNNLFGTQWNSPIYTITNGRIRTTVMGRNPAGSITGAFGLGTILPQSYFHASNFGTGNFAPQGRMFRTDGSSTFSNQWQLFTGANVNNVTLKFRVFTTINSPIANGTTVSDQNITLEASQRDMIFNAGGSTERMRILGQDHDLSVTSPWYAVAREGNVGIGTAHPLSLLHMGGNGAAGAGWRTWMDIGTYYASRGGYDNMYVGLKEIGPDRNEAIINWGNNPSTAPGNADRLRFIFTAAQGNGLASSVDGLEIARMWANNQGDGRMGVGDFFTANADPQNTMEIRASQASPYWNSPGGASGLRLSFLTANTAPLANPGNGVLSVDQNGDVIYVQSTSPSGNGFTGCSDQSGTANLGENSFVNLNNFNLFFDGHNTTSNRIGIGYGCTDNILSKLNVRSFNEEWNTDFFTDNTTPVNPLFQGGIRSVIDRTRARNATAILGVVQPNNSLVMTSQIGVHGISNGRDVKEAIGVRGEGSVQISTGGAIGGYFSSEGSGFSRAVIGFSRVAQLQSAYSGFGFGGDFIAQSVNNQVQGVYGVRGASNCADCETSVGGTFTASGNGQNNIGIRATANGGQNNLAALFEGDVQSSGDVEAASFTIGSDAMFKTNVTDMSNALNKINQLEPKEFNYDTVGFERFNFQSDIQMGMIAQEVQNVLPNIVHTKVRPAEYDSLGNEIYPEVNYLAVEYVELVPLLIAGMQEQQTEINSKDSIINNLNDRLTQLENCLSGILPFLCQMSHTAIEQNDETIQEQLIRTINVELTDKNNIVLNQNVPNPFAESTVITYSIPESVGKAQIHFYNGTGQLINSVDIDERGAGRMNVFGSDLSSGVYTYSLVADGKVVSTKRMVKQ